MDTGEPAATEVPDEDLSLGESPLPPAIALIVFMAINIALRVWLPRGGAVRQPWLVPAVEVVVLVLLFLLLTSDPVSVRRRVRWLHELSVTFVCILVAAALWATTLLVYDLIKGIGETNSPTKLLATGSVVWLGNNISFALLYWLIDGGGPLVRTHQRVPVDFAFTQQLSPELAPPGWKPVFLDYLHLGFTNATAFSPTDVMPLTLRAKYTMVLQSTVSLALFGLIVARAVNAFP